MHILGIKDKKDLKNVVAFWVFRTIKYIIFALKTYNSWSIKAVCNNNNLKNFRDNHQTQKILKKNGLIKPMTSF